MVFILLLLEFGRQPTIGQLPILHLSDYRFPVNPLRVPVQDLRGQMAGGHDTQNPGVREVPARLILLGFVAAVLTDFQPVNRLMTPTIRREALEQTRNPLPV